MLSITTFVKVTVIVGVSFASGFVQVVLVSLHQSLNMLSGNALKLQCTLP